jgi:hypothetical protein
VHRSIQQNFKEAPDLLGFESVGLVRGKNLGLFSQPARPSGMSCGAGGGGGGRHRVGICSEMYFILANGT